MECRILKFENRRDVDKKQVLLSDFKKVITKKVSDKDLYKIWLATGKYLLESEELRSSQRITLEVSLDLATQGKSS